MTAQTSIGPDARCIGLRLQITRVSGDSCLAYDPVSSGSLSIHGTLAALLPRIATFRTFEEHAREAAKSGWGGGDASLARDALRELAAMGLVVTGDEIVRQIARQRGDEPEPISVLVWPTKDREELLLRSVKSFIGNARAYGRSPLYCVLNDSASVSREPALLGALARISHETGSPFRYAGMNEKAAFIGKLSERLAPEGCPPDVIRFALSDFLRCGPTYGANRNASFLSTAGRMVFSVDDDIVCAPAPAPVMERGMALVEIPDPAEHYFYNSRDELLKAVALRDTDILAVHEELLGRTVASIMNDENTTGDIRLDMGGGPFLESLLTGPVRVAATMGGSYGDSGTGTPRALLIMTGASRERLTASENAYRESFRSRELVQVFTRTSISPAPYFQTMNVGLDNRVILPPAIPVLRGEDYIFANTIRICMRNHVLGFPPWALAHFPGETRAFTENAAILPALFFSEQAFIAIHSFTPSPGMDAPRDRMQALGTHLRSIASMDGADYESFIKSRWIAQAGYRIGLMENSLMEYGHQPSFWARDLERAIKSMEEFALKGEASVPSDLLQGRTPSEARALGKKILGMYGELLYWWPLIYDTARAMKQEGVEITRAL